MRSLFALATFSILTIFAATSDIAGQDGDTPKSSPEALTVYSDAASFQNNGEFALSAEEWEKFLKAFPNDPLAPKARHYAGVCYLQLKAYDKAADHFEAILRADPKFELAEDAFLNLGWCRYSMKAEDRTETLTKAGEAFAALVRQFPKGKYADQALFYLGESLYALQKKPEAIAAYRKLVEEHPKSSLRSDGLYALGVTYEEEQKYSEAGAVYDLFLQEFADSALNNEVRMRKAETILQGGDVATAEKMFGDVAGLEGFASADHAIFRQAYCAAKLEKLEEAGQLYAKLVTDFPQSVYVNDATISAGRTFYRANDFANAATWFQKSIDAGTRDAGEAAHWLCRIHLQNNEPNKAISLAEQQIPKNTNGAFLVNLKLDQADGLYAIPDRREESLEKYLQIVSEDSDHQLAAQALYNAAFTSLEIGKYDEGIKHAAAFIAKYPEDRFLPDTKYVAADCNLKLGRHEEAEAGYRDLLANFKDHSEYDAWRVRLGLVLYLQKKYEEVIVALQETVKELKQAAQAAEAQFLLGASQFQLDQFEPAAKSLVASLAADPKWRQADETLLFLSRAQRGQKQLAAAKKTVSELISEFPESAVLDQANFRLGEYNYAAGDYPAATAAYDVVIEKFNKSIFAPYAYFGKGWSSLKGKQFSVGIESFTSLIEEYPEHTLKAEALLARGMCRRQTADFDDAIADFNAFLKTNPSQPQNSDALYERGLAEVALKKFEQATATLETLLEQNKEYASTANVLYELGWAYTNRNQPEDAVATFAKLASGYPESPLAAEANLHVAEAHYSKGEFADAVKAYEAAKSKAESGEVGERSIHKLGWALYREEKYDAALAEFEQQLKTYADGGLVADGLFMKGECLYKLKKYADAFQAFMAATKSPSADEQKHVLTLLHGGQSAGQEGNWKASLDLLDQVASKFPDTPFLAEAIYERGFAKQNLKQLDDAIKDYERAAELSRGEVGARGQFMIGEVLFEQKKFDAAIRAFKRVMYGYGGEQAPDDVKQWQAVAGYEAGRCAEVQISNASDPGNKSKLIADAKSSFSYVIQRHPTNDKVQQAKTQLSRLEKLR
ncbi:MAG: tetratricopeptide repeat protein [Planctomycetaceae bacterium]|nr:tetratricopeptide repeat protein [Planctomycetales bacterium]MCB9920741.1 tetratricopeptide repeat protein [Planctomycetaceae bacterium]